MDIGSGIAVAAIAFAVAAYYIYELKTQHDLKMKELELKHSEKEDKKDD